MNTILELQSAHIDAHRKQIPQWARAEHLERIVSEKELQHFDNRESAIARTLPHLRHIIAKALRKAADALCPEDTVSGFNVGRIAA